MQQRRIWSFLMVSSLSALSLAWTQEDTLKANGALYTLRVNVKEGETYKYEMTMHTDFGGQPLVFSVTLIDKVVKVDSEGNYTIESTQENGLVIFGYQEMPAPARPPTKATFRPNGSLLKMEGENNPATGSFVNINYPDKPVKVGDKWEYEYQPSKESPKIKVEYEVVGVEKVNEIDTLKIKVKGKSLDESQMPMSFDGHTWVDIKTGMMVRTTMAIKGLPVQGAPAPIDGTMRMELVK